MLQQSSSGTARPKLLFADVRVAASGKWEQILRDLSSSMDDAIEKAPNHVPCPVHPSSVDGFRLFKDFRDTGGGICNTCGPKTDGFTLLSWVNGWALGKSLQEVARWLGMDDPIRRETVRTVKPIVAPKPKELDPYKQKRLNETWTAAYPATSKEAEPLRRYLSARGVLPTVLPETLRFHPTLPYFIKNKDGSYKKLGELPAILAMVSGPSGNPVTLHRTYITLDGRKSPVPKAKKMMSAALEGSVSGGAIRLYPVQECLGLTEGIETALAVHCATGMPVWACVSDTMLQGVVIPDTAQEIIIWADLDINGAGAKAAKALHDRLTLQGRSSVIQYPADALSEDKDGIDWADIYVGLGKSGFPAEYTTSP